MFNALLLYSKVNQPCMLSCFSCVSYYTNGNPIQYSCLENPMDRAPRWAAVAGGAQSLTQLK